MYELTGLNKSNKAIFIIEINIFPKIRLFSSYGIYKLIKKKAKQERAIDS